MKLQISKSILKNKKYTAFFTENGKTKRVHFGAAGYRDYTLISNLEEAKKAKSSYTKRHAKDHINNYITPGSLSWYILWGPTQNISQNILFFKRKFRLD